MILTLKRGVKKHEVNRIIEKIHKLGFKAHISHGVERTIIGIIGPSPERYIQEFEQFEEIESIAKITKPYRLVSREFKPENTVIRVNDVKIGGSGVVIMAGPCSVESKKQIIEIAKYVKKTGCHILRGGAYKPRTSPYTFQGLREEGLKLLKEAKKITGLPIITEVLDTRDVERVLKYADILQIGARNVQNFELLKEVGKAKKPVFLKRGLATTIEEYLLAAEYIYSNGNPDIILCERGIRTFETSTRFTLDLNAVPVLKKNSHLPVFVDPSHGVGIREAIPHMALAAIACGADGIMLETHPRPAEALSDGAQAILPATLEKLVKDIKKVAQAVGRDLY